MTLSVQLTRRAILGAAVASLVAIPAAADMDMSGQTVEWVILSAWYGEPVTSATAIVV